MTYYNNIILIGNVASEAIGGTDKEDGVHFYFPLAVERNPDRPEDESLEVDFHRITFITKDENHPIHSIKKGNKVIVSGKLINRKYSSNDEYRYYTEVEAKSIEILTR